MTARVRCFGLQRFFAGVAVAASIGAVSVAARAAVVTQQIDAEVLSVSGENASFFAGADRVIGSLRYDDAVPDSNPDPETGAYAGALVSLTATIPALGFGWSASAGSLTTFRTRPLAATSSPPTVPRTTRRVLRSTAIRSDRSE
jgi:hypothetical protein